MFQPHTEDNADLLWNRAAQKANTAVKTRQRFSRPIDKFAQVRRGMMYCTVQGPGNDATYFYEQPTETRQGPHAARSPQVVTACAVPRLALGLRTLVVPPSMRPSAETATTTQRRLGRGCGRGI